MPFNTVHFTDPSDPNSTGPAGPKGDTGDTGPAGPKGDKGDQGDAGILSASYGCFHDEQTQSFTLQEVEDGIHKSVYLRTTDLSKNISIVDETKITFAESGVYDIQFSFQWVNQGGGGSGTEVEVWLAKNGNYVTESNTRIVVNTNSPYIVSAWDFMVDATSGDYYELNWWTNNHNIVMLHNTAMGPGPHIPSAIVTVIQVGI